MGYNDACDSVITAKQAKREVERHGAEWLDFIADIGEADAYIGSVILEWLGY